MTVATVDPRTVKLTPERLLGLVEQNGTALIEGTNLMCPACETAQNILAYIPLEHSVKFSDQIVVPLKCRLCRHVFALKP